jgi:hypothetical protein
VAHSRGSYDAGVWRIDATTLGIKSSIHVGDEVQMVVAEGSIWLYG